MKWNKIHQSIGTVLPVPDRFLLVRLAEVTRQVSDSTFHVYSDAVVVGSYEVGTGWFLPGIVGLGEPTHWCYCSDLDDYIWHVSPSSP